MMNSADCAKRSAACLKAAESSPGSEVQQRWQRLSELWMAWSGLVDHVADPARMPIAFPRLRKDPPYAAH